MHRVIYLLCLREAKVVEVGGLEVAHDLPHEPVVAGVRFPGLRIVAHGDSSPSVRPPVRQRPSDRHTIPSRDRLWSKSPELVSALSRARSAANRPRPRCWSSTTGAYTQRWQKQREVDFGASIRFS